MPNCLTLKKSNCKNCYKCIRHCPVKAIRFSGNQAHIIGNECILCGQCFVVCPQNAKQIIDETEKVKVFLQSGAPVIVSLAPSFVANYDGAGINSMRDALKKLGFYDVEETAIGATIVKTEYERMLREEERDVVITSCCHSVNLLIQKYFPAELEYLADVLSPMQAHCMARLIFMIVLFCPMNIPVILIVIGSISLRRIRSPILNTIRSRRSRNAVFGLGDT